MLGSLNDISISKKEYFLTTWLIAISGVNYFLGNTYLAISCIMVYVFFYKNKRTVSNILVKYLVFVGVIFMGSAIWYSSLNLTNYLSMFVRIITAFMIIDIIKDKFVYAYVKIMYVICLIGLVSWTIFVLSPDIEHFFLANITPIFDFYFYETDEGVSANLEGYRPAPHFIVYTMNHGNPGFLETQLDYLSIFSGFERVFMRNSSCFTEPSSAMLFIIPALIFNLVVTNNTFDKRNLVFALAVLTSWSTGGLSVLFVVLGGWMVFQKKTISKLLLLPIIVAAGYVAFINIDSFGAEILEKVSVFEGDDLTKSSRTRFVSGFLDFKEALSHPLFGKGFYNDGVFNYLDDHRNNGTLFLLNKYGFIAFFLYFFLMYRFFNVLCTKHGVTRKFAYAMIVSIMLIGFGNKNFEKPFFIGLTMIYSLQATSISRLGKNGLNGNAKLPTISA